ncbi:hypothetical protein BDF22DRAFT_776183 [Syncephalis plumigaleata]|nr:hypothetical protein BDF22DRAFT_776183 [Syncephalis plumigaleata]
MTHIGSTRIDTIRTSWLVEREKRILWLLKTCTPMNTEDVVSIQQHGLLPVIIVHRHRSLGHPWLCQCCSYAFTPGSQSLTGGQGSPQLQAGQIGGLKRASSQGLIKNQPPTSQVTPADLDRILAERKLEQDGMDQESKLQEEIITRLEPALNKFNVPELRQILVLMEQGSSRMEQKIAERRKIIRQLKPIPEQTRTTQQKIILIQMENGLLHLQKEYDEWKPLIAGLKETFAKLGQLQQRSNTRSTPTAD